jgi:hypothetical protein
MKYKDALIAWTPRCADLADSYAATLGKVRVGPLLTLLEAVGKRDKKRHE